MNTEHIEIEQKVEKYRVEVEPLLRYIPWLESKVGAQVSHNYDGEGSRTFSFPIYDGTLLAFVKEASASALMNRNYVYVFTKNRLDTIEKQLCFIEQAKKKDLDALAGILSKYVLGGMTKGRLWAEAVEYGIFLKVLLKMKEILAFWNQPLA